MFSKDGRRHEHCLPDRVWYLLTTDRDHERLEALEAAAGAVHDHLAQELSSDDDEVPPLRRVRRQPQVTGPTGLVAAVAGPNHAPNIPSAPTSAHPAGVSNNMDALFDTWVTVSHNYFEAHFAF